MRTVKLFFATLLLVVMSSNTYAQMHDHNAMIDKTETNKVWGNCDMCKSRIEKAAKVDGVTKANWNSDTKA